MTPFDTFNAAAEPVILDRIDIPARPERRASPPASFTGDGMGEWLEAMAGGNRSLWSHQALALQHIDEGRNVLLATSTASGKTLPFTAAAVREIMRGEGTTIAFYHQKSLASDQAHRWKAAVELAGFSPDLVGELHGDVQSDDRDIAMETARIVVTTPDTCHAWLMRLMSARKIRHFLQRLRFLVIDEAHAYEGVFGSHCAYLFRRLRAAAARAKLDGGATHDLQLIAATATIAEPAVHLERLTGCHFAVIGDDQNGAPFHGLSYLHVDGPSHGSAAEKLVGDIASNLVPLMGTDSFIAFIDGRQGAERIALACGDEVSPYRSGYEAQDRYAIESGLRNGTLRGVITTSALEVGVDISQFTIGINLGVPMSLKSLLQRAGRAGRASQAVFAVIAEPIAFAQTGRSFREFIQGEVEPSPIYLENPIVQFQQACCLRAEVATEDGAAVLPDSIEWPAGFAEAFELAQPAARRPRDLDRIAMMGTGNPHHDYSLRQICDVEYVLRLIGNESVVIGKIRIDKAMREACPGATYIHCGQRYIVDQWRSNNYEHSILVRAVKNAARTTALIQARVSISHDPGEVIENRLLTSRRGSMAEISLRVAESVEGYSLGKTQYFYRELSKTDRRKSHKQREFTSTGIAIEIDEPWFRGTSEGPVAVRRMVADGLLAVLAREKSIAPSELRAVHSGIAKIVGLNPRPIDNAVVILDNVAGGLRLTEWLFSNFDRALGLLRRGSELAGADALVDLRTIERLEDWFAALGTPNPDEPAAAIEIPAGERLIYAPGSVVGVRHNGTLHERRLIEPQLFAVGGSEQLMYLYDTGPGAIALVPHNQIEAVGHDWRHLIWNPETNMTKEIVA